MATSFRGSRRGCLAEAVPGSYTGRSIAFGIDAPLERRRFKLETLCPTFTLTFEDAQNMRVAAGDRYSRRQQVVARIPLVAIDFGAPHFVHHEIRGVRTRPSARPGGPRSAAGQRRPVQGLSPPGRRERLLRHARSGQRRRRRGHRLAWDVLYDLRFSRDYKQSVTSIAFRKAALERYGPPSSERPGYLVWIYDLAGNLVRLPDPMSNSCRATAEYWLAHDGTRIDHVDRDANSNDLGPWGCSLIMEMGARAAIRSVDGHVPGGGVGAVGRWPAAATATSLA